MKREIEKFLRRVRHFFIVHSRDPRPSSAPFISGDTFRSFATRLYDETFKCSGIDIYPQAVVFVKADLIDEWFANVHPHITNPYTIITHNSDRNITEADIKKYLEDPTVGDKIIKWFAQNVSVEGDPLHPKLIPLPIALENAHHTHHGRIAKFKKWQDKLRAGKVTKKPRILTAFSPSTNLAERVPALEYFKTHPHSLVISSYITSDEHRTLLAESMFVASPPGNGLDCIRTWEALYLRTVPIVKRSAMTEYFKSLGLPLLLVDDWHELDSVDEAKLVAVYDEMKNGFDNQALTADYWKALMQSGK